MDSTDPARRVREQLERWRDDLLDLTGRNRLLRFRHTKTSSLEIDSPSAQEIVDKLSAGRSREWRIFLPEEREERPDYDPTAAPLGVAYKQGATSAKGVVEALDRLGIPAEGGTVHVSFGALRWTTDATRTAALLLLRARVERTKGWRLRIEEPELFVNPALLAYMESEFEVYLGEERYRIESAGIQDYLDQLKEDLAPLGAKLDDRIGLLSASEHERLQAGELDLTPGVLITDAPREGVLAALAGAEDDGLGLQPARPRIGAVALPASKAQTGPVLRTTKATATDVRAACAGLARRTTQEFMDKGLWILYLGIGLLHWSDPADGRAEAQDSPLLLLPVRLTSARRGAEWKLHPTEEEPLVNPALWMKLSGDLGIELPELEEGEPLDVAALLHAVRAAIAEHPAWTVEERVVLSTFSFHKEVMYRDLRDNFEQIVEHPIIRGLAREPGPADDADAEAPLDFEPVAEDRLDEQHPPEQATTILDADASQRQCVAAAREGRSFVMDGPPGTGKSQTIANMIAELIADGRTVLFVSEKAAALDVVHNRLEQVGLHEYVLELHSHKTTRAAVALGLGESLLRRPRPAPALSDSDLGEAGRRRAALNAYATALNTPRPQLGGRTLHHLLGSIAALQELPQAPVAERPPSDIAAVGELGERLRGTWEVVERGEDFVWRETSAGTWGASVEQRVLQRLDATAEALTELRDCADAVAGELALDPPAGARDASDLCAVVDLLDDRPAAISASWLSEVQPDTLRAVAAAAADRARRYRRACQEAERTAGPSWVQLDARGGEAQRLLAAFEQAGVTLAPEARAADIRTLAEHARTLAGLLDALRGPASDVAALLGLRSVDLDLAAADGCARLAAIGVGEDAPARAWVTSPSAAARVRKALLELRGPVQTTRAARAAADAFQDAVLDLDLDGLRTRFEQQHRGLKRLGGAFREDRATLAATAPNVKPKEAVARIDQAVQWQKAQRALDKLAARHTKALGDAWSGVDTDLDELERRIANAELAFELAGDRIADKARLATAVSSGAGLAQIATTVDAGVARVRSQAPQALSSMLERPLDSARAALEEIASQLDVAALLVEDADDVRGTGAGAERGLAAHVAVAAVAQTRSEHAEAAEQRAVLGERWHVLDGADPDALEDAAGWAIAVRERCNPSRTAAGLLVRGVPEGADLDEALARHRDAADTLLLEFGQDRRPALAGELDADFDDGLALLQRLRTTRGDIETWNAHARAVQALRDGGLGAAVDYCRDRGVESSQLVGVLRRSALEATADALLHEERAALETLRAADRDRLVREFAGLDRRVVADAAHRVMESANARRPNAILGVASIIANEAQKKKRHMPVSELLRRTAPVAQAIKPCFMMSPLSVSQYLSPDMRFDVVIFDEASQVRPCDAVNALYRGSAMIVAGDQKQLPPTSFFEQSTEEGDEWSEDALSEFESVLDLGKGSGAFRSLSLRWHYRSRHEHLIAFSNHRFYGGGLVTFPSPTEESDDLGVVCLPVEGSYRRGTSRDNPVEAQAVADRVFAHAARGTTSIGVVAFSEAQASLIEEVLRRDERTEDPRFASLFTEDRLEGLFIKNLENVQGDERDVIIFSVGYGPDEHDKLTMNFGPLNREGGWRRLNVAITRARRRVEVICSFAGDRLVAGSGSRGVDELRRYLEFAARGPVALAVSGPDDGDGGEPESPFEEAVMRTVRSWGYGVVAQVGTAGYRIDLGVRHPDRPGRFALGIECDGAMYHSSRVARDRDRLREQVLGGLGWTLHRIWGPSWYRDRAGEERRLREAIERAALGETPVGPGPSEVRVEVQFDDLDLDGAPSWAEPYVAAVLPAPQAADPGLRQAATELRTMVMHVVTEEGPIVEDLITRRVIGAWGAVISERRRGAVTKCVAGLVAGGSLVRRGGAYCLPGQTTDLVRVPVDGDERTAREVRHVPRIELAEAVARFVAEARIVTEEEALRRAARLFGWKRSGAAIQAAMGRAVDQLADERRVVRDGTTLRAPESAAP